MNTILIIPISGTTDTSITARIKIDFGAYKPGDLANPFGDSSDNEIEYFGDSLEAYIADSIEINDYQYYSADKMIVPGFTTLQIFDTQKALTNLLFSKIVPKQIINFGRGMFVNRDFRVEKVLLEIKRDNEVISAGQFIIEQSEHDEETGIFTFVAAPRTDFLKTIDIRNVAFPDKTLYGILHTILTYSDTYNNVVCPGLKKSDVQIKHNLQLKSSYGYTDANLDLKVTEFPIQSFDKIRFDPKRWCDNLGSYSAYDLLSSICFTFYSTLFITTKKIVFSSIFLNTSTNLIELDATIGFETYSEFQKLYYVRVKENNIPGIDFTVGKYSEVYPGIDKSVPIMPSGYTIWANQYVSYGADGYGFAGATQGQDDELLTVEIPHPTIPSRPVIHSFIDPTFSSDEKGISELAANAWYYFRAYDSINSTLVRFKDINSKISVDSTIKRGDIYYSPVAIKQVVDSLGTISELTCVQIPSKV